MQPSACGANRLHGRGKIFHISEIAIRAQPVTAQDIAQLQEAWCNQLLSMLAHAAQVSNLYVADASLFPTSTGVNPMITVEAMAYMVAQGLAQNFKDGAAPQSQKAVFMPEE